jgi:hypothetical protein
MRKIFQYITLGILNIILIFSFFSCAGAKCTVQATQVTQPVSYTSCVLNKEGRIIKVNEQQIVKHFKIQKEFWTMLYKLVKLTDKDWDISEELKKQLAESNGNAIVNVTVSLTGHAYWYFSALIPIIPSYQTVVIEGDIAKIPE